MKIEDLVDFPALQQLARALWREGTARGAAILIGAGFSKNAERPGADTPEPPLWRDLKREMVAQLYRDAAGDAPEDPLKLAEEYRTNFGQAALDEFVRSQIHDGAWEPGALHRALLELPWSDVLSTNWDTLLERTPAAVRREIVRTTADLAHGRERRIIKLHGSVGTSEHYIFAEEDYRTYPTRFAAFVNTARQIFIENELCLLGFSGDDPNFLQWSGWVRDHLGESARRIYLVGALGLRQTKRKFLESRNIAPIDLAPLVEGGTRNEREAAATALFLEFLAKAKPAADYDWKPAEQSAYSFLPVTMPDIQRQATDADYAASLLDQAAKVWRADRESYPGWLVCPVGRRQELLIGINAAHWQRPAALRTLEPTRQAKILYELVWRHTVAYEPLDPGLTVLLEAVADPDRASGLDKRQQLEIALALVRLARQGNEDERFDRWASVLEGHCGQDSDLQAQVIYHRCLRARDRLDYETLTKDLKALGGTDPIWRLRKAALHSELGEFAEASALIISARDDLTERQRRDENSLWVRSRRAWCEWVSRAARRDWSFSAQTAWSSEFSLAHCDPEDEIDRLNDVAAEALRKQREENVTVISRFEPGHYHDPSRTVRFRSGPMSTPLYALSELIEAVGVPFHLNHYDPIGRAKKDAAELNFEPTFEWYVWLLRALQNQLDRLFDRYLGRVAIAGLPTDVTSALAEKATAAIAYWRRRHQSLAINNVIDRTFAIERLRLFVEVLARVTARQDGHGARASFELAMDIARDSSLRHLWLIEPVGDLARYSILAIPPSDRSRLVLAALEFPLSIEAGIPQTAWEWPNPIQSLFETRPLRPDGDARWANRIRQLLHEASAGRGARHEAALRLYYLSSQGALATDEREAFGAALWSATDGAASPVSVSTNLLAHTFASLPAPAGVDSEASVRGHLFDIDLREVLAAPEPQRSQQMEDKYNRLLESPLRRRVRFGQRKTRWPDFSARLSNGGRQLMRKSIKSTRSGLSIVSSIAWLNPWLAGRWHGR
jgi:SIR2-like domain